MAAQYWIGEFYVDPSRNQITQERRTQTIPPKALAVLTYLAQNQGDVISQERLLAAIWQDTAVTANTLQRSIAQLRKALGDDAKAQVYIKTHAKQGYSLECDVRWQEGTQEPSPDSVPRSSQSQPGAATPARTRKLILPLVAVGICVGLIVISMLSRNPSTEITVETMRSLTATDDKEFDATYTPDGQTLIFHRYKEQYCINRIWAKDIDTQQEYLLTKAWGNYDNHSVSQDGTRLVFLATEACSEPICYNLMSLDLEQAMESPQTPELMLQCKTTEIQKPVWLNDNSIALMQKRAGRWKLIRYLPEEDRSVDVYRTEEGNLVDFAYASWEDLLAVVSVQNDDQHYLELLNPDGRVLSKHLIERPPEVPRFRRIYPSFDPGGKQLIFSTGRQLFSLSYEGKVTKISLPSPDTLLRPVFHPDGDRLLMIKGPYDRDVVLRKLGPDQDNPDQVFERSILGEDQAVFQPNGSMIAFWSERSGTEQLWLSDGNSAQQLSRFPLDTYISGIAWASDGQSLLVNANNELYQINLDAGQKSLPMDHPVTQLLQWNSEAGTALLLVRVRGLKKLMRFNLTTSELREITDLPVAWAQESQDGRLIYKDHTGQFWQPGPAEPQPIMALENQGTRTARFIVRGNTIYDINAQNQLWSYNLTDNSFTRLGTVADTVNHLTDADQGQVLMTLSASAKKEVVELRLIRNGTN